MKIFKCPLRQNALKNPSSYFIQGDETFTYFEFDQYVQQIASTLHSFKEGQVIAIKVQNPLFVIALLIACMRKKLILFLLSSRLPQSEIGKRVKEANAQYLFQDPITFNSSLKNIVKNEISLDLKLPISYLLTSGSSTCPKICVHSLENHIYSALGSNKSILYLESDSWLLSLPLFHVGGLSLIFRTLLAKASLTLSNDTLEESLKKNLVTHISLVPTQLQKLIDKPSLLKPLKVILLGGGPISESLYKKALANSLPIQVTYGLTEMASQVATSTEYDSLSILPYREVILDKENQILVRGKTLFMGYLENTVIIPHTNLKGWFETKDLGEIKNNKLKIIGRLDNQFISGGENIQPEEIELELLKHPSIIEAIVIPKSDDIFGKVPVAYIKTSKEISNSELISFLEQVLPKFKIPKIYLPLTYSTLKPCRNKLSFNLSSGK